MKMKPVILIFFLFIIAACELQKNETLIVPNKAEACNRSSRLDLNELLEIDSTQSLDSKMFQAKTIDQSGKLTEISINEALSMICEMKDLNTPKYPLPIVERIGTQQAILFSNSKGQWGPVWTYILINRETKTIENLKCGHSSEAPVGKIDFKDSIYSNKYRNIPINAFEASKDKIDGATGATETHNAYLNAVKNGIEKYNKYCY